MKILSLYIALVLFVAKPAYAWNDVMTHPTISEYAGKLFFGSEYLNKDVNGKIIKDLIRDGARLEDAGTAGQFLGGTARSLNHFHSPTTTNPTKDTIETSGLSDLPFFMSSGMSALAWAQNGPYQISKGWGDWSWQKVREHQYNYLTSLNKADMDANLARLMMGLGYQMHLVQDMGHPSHVRNNTHMIDGKGWGGFETWAAKNDENIIRAGILDRNDLFPVPDVSVDLTVPFDATHRYAPVARLFDTRTYLGTSTPTAQLNQGLSEYTNSNFFSQNTIFAAERFSGNHENKYYFPYPRREGTDIQAYINKTKPAAMLNYVSKTGEGEQLTYLARDGASTRLIRNVLGVGKQFYGSFKLDDNCYLEYAQKLIPRSVGYSIALLDYFYRGNVKITANPTDISFRSIKINVQNNTPGETMRVGEVKLIIRYKALSEWNTGGNKYQLNNPPDDTNPDKYTYKVSSPQYVDLTNPQALTFDFSTDTLPYFFDDMTMQLVFKGKLGNEEGAVAVSQLEPINGVYSDFTVSLPATGVYAKTTDNTLGATFNELKVMAQTDMPAGLTGGSFELALEYRKTGGDPFQSLPVDTEPVNAAGYVLRVAEKNGVSILQPGMPVELVFDLFSVPLPVSATDVYLNIIYKNSNTSKTVAVGLNDIPEPTPVDIFNNADMKCINGQWYPAGSSQAIALSSSNNDGISDLFDPYQHDISNIYYKISPISSPSLASANNFTFSSPALLTSGSHRRLGYVLSDISFNHHITEQWLNATLADDWEIYGADKIYQGIAIKNQDGLYPAMYTMRGYKMWSGTSLTYDNEEYPSDGKIGVPCAWESLSATP